MAAGDYRFNGMQDQEYIDEYDQPNAMGGGGGGGYLDQGPTSLGPPGGGRGGWGINSDPLDDYAAGFTDDEVDDMRVGSRYENHTRFGSKGHDQEPRSKGGGGGGFFWT